MEHREGMIEKKCKIGNSNVSFKLVAKFMRIVMMVASPFEPSS